jgi:hypothetical protein
MLQQMVRQTAPQIGDMKSILDSPELDATTPNIVRPGFEDTSTWEDILGILKDDSATAFGCSASISMTKRTHRNQ